MIVGMDAEEEDPRVVSILLDVGEMRIVCEDEDKSQELAACIGNTMKCGIRCIEIPGESMVLNLDHVILVRCIAKQSRSED